MNNMTLTRTNRKTKVNLIFTVIYLLIGFYITFGISQFLNPPLDSELQIFTESKVSIQCNVTTTEETLVVTVDTSSDHSSVFYLEGCQATNQPNITGKTAKLFNDELWALEYNNFYKVTYERTRAKYLITPLMVLFALLPLVIIAQLLLIKAANTEDENKA